MIRSTEPERVSISISIHGEYLEPAKIHLCLYENAAPPATFEVEDIVSWKGAAGTAAAAYNLAVADYFGKPEILDIDISRWTGQASQQIYIRAKDNFMVVRVRLVIRPNGQDYDALDGGEAVQSGTDGLLWVFTTTAPIDIVPEMQLDAYAYDLPGNLGKDTLVLS